jgi:hypothetical protein
MPIVLIVLLNSSVSYGLELTNRSIAISSTLPSATANYSVGFDIGANETLGSIMVQFCSNTPIIYISCTAPAGFNASSAVLGSQTGISGLVIDSALSNQYTLVLSRSPSLATAGPVTLDFTNIINPSTVGTFFGRIATYATSNASGSATDIGGIAMAITNSYTVSATVPPYLLLCVGVVIPNLNCAQAQGNLINFGNLTPYSTAAAQSQMVIATNAFNGYSIEVSGNTMTSGNNILPPLNSGQTSLPGTSQFGINLVANNRPAVGLNPLGAGTGYVTNAYAQPNIYKFSSGDIIAESNQVSSYKEYTISYILNIAKNQPPGVYTTTISYIGMAYF